jgi:hypothetical protein
MEMLFDLARRIAPHGLDLWSVIAGALLLAIVQRVAQGRPGRGYDAWWLFHVDPASVKAPLPPSRPRLEPILPVPPASPPAGPAPEPAQAALSGGSDAVRSSIDAEEPPGLGAPAHGSPISPSRFSSSVTSL